MDRLRWRDRVSLPLARFDHHPSAILESLMSVGTSQERLEFLG
jgi:hypothetical protein